ETEAQFGVIAGAAEVDDVHHATSRTGRARQSRSWSRVIDATGWANGHQRQRLALSSTSGTPPTLALIGLHPVAHRASPARSAIFPDRHLVELVSSDA